MQKIVSAGDLEKYAYCPLSWWLSRESKDHTEKEEKGIERHREIEKTVNEIAIKERETKNIERMIFIFSFFATVISLFGVIIWPMHPSILLSRIFLVEAMGWLIFSLYFLIELEKGPGREHKKLLERLIVSTAVGSAVIAVYAVGFVFPQDKATSEIMQVSALLWLMAATAFLWRETRIETQVRAERKKMQMPEGEIIYVDLEDESSEVLISRRYGLSGRPDHIIEKNGRFIPVELKTGRTPRGPLFSHIVQVGAYCLIIEDVTGKAPPNGIIKYPEKSFEIEFTEELKGIVLKKREELLSDLERGEAHRNHNRPGKCRNCSRRNICPERLV